MKRSHRLLWAGALSASVIATSGAEAVHNPATQPEARPGHSAGHEHGRTLHVTSALGDCGITGARLGADGQVTLSLHYTGGNLELIDLSAGQHGGSNEVTAIPGRPGDTARPTTLPAHCQEAARSMSAPLTPKT
jgi:hypothetical protein